MVYVVYQLSLKEKDVVYNPRSQKRRAGIYLSEGVYEILDGYAEERGVSRNVAIEEIVLFYVLPEWLVVKPELVRVAVNRVVSRLKNP